MQRGKLACVAIVLLAVACESPVQPDRLSVAPPAPPEMPALEVTVTLSAAGCRPRPTKPCALAAVATVTSKLPPMEPLRFKWSGCTAGAESRATCSVDRPGENQTIVDVADQSGRTARAVAIADGINRPPAPSIFEGLFYESSLTVGFIAYHNDPDEAWGCDARRQVSVSGDCETPVDMCGGTLTGGDIEIYARKRVPAGICTVTFTATDEWGASGTVTTSIPFPRR